MQEMLKLRVSATPNFGTTCGKNLTTIKAFTFEFKDEATGISTIENGQWTNDNVIYNLAGQRLNKMQKGINIINGKKVLR